jgi:hypothetical protein
LRNVRRVVGMKSTRNTALLPRKKSARVWLMRSALECSVIHVLVNLVGPAAVLPPPPTSVVGVMFLFFSVHSFVCFLF